MQGQKTGNLRSSQGDVLFVFRGLPVSVCDQALYISQYFRLHLSAVLKPFTNQWFSLLQRIIFILCPQTLGFLISS